MWKNYSDTPMEPMTAARFEEYAERMAKHVCDPSPPVCVDLKTYKDAEANGWRVWWERSAHTWPNWMKPEGITEDDWKRRADQYDEDMRSLARAIWGIPETD